MTIPQKTIHAMVEDHKTALQKAAGATIPPSISEQELAEIQGYLAGVSPFASQEWEYEQRLIAEVRRLQDRNADLIQKVAIRESIITDLKKQLVATQDELYAEVSHPAPETITGPSWLNVQTCECGHSPDDHDHKTLQCVACECSCFDAEYARGLRA